MGKVLTVLRASRFGKVMLDIRATLLNGGIMTRKLLSILLGLLMLLPLAAEAKSHSGSSKHYANQGGHYSGGKSSSHKGGHYKNARTHDHYTHHK
jgi:hypothetical protein